MLKIDYSVLRCLNPFSSYTACKSEYFIFIMRLINWPKKKGKKTKIQHANHINSSQNRMKKNSYYYCCVSWRTSDDLEKKQTRIKSYVFINSVLLE